MGKEDQTQAGLTAVHVAVAVTTAPRTPFTLRQCRDSLRAAGWQSIRVYAEPRTPLSEADLSGDIVVQRTMLFGAWRNWMFAAMDMLAQTDADGILMVQDDTVWSPSARKALERMKWPAKDVGYVQCAVSSGYAPHCRGKPKGLVKLPEAMITTVMGAWGVLFPRSSLERIVKFGLERGWCGVHKHRSGTVWEKDPAKRKAIDQFIGVATKSEGLSAWVWNPSLAQHLCRHSGSTLGHDEKGGWRLAIRSALGWKEGQ